MAEVLELGKRIGSTIRVFARDGREIKGVLRTCDEHQNLVLEEAEEYWDQKLVRKHKFLFLKGGNIRIVEV
ncbi:MAG: LSM domain-containing protein [Candidatus Hadarchaeales archaeon]